MFEITAGSTDERKSISMFLPHLGKIDNKLAELVVTAWITVWKSSTYRDSDPTAFAYTVLAPNYRLMDHVGEVTELGVMLANYRAERWSEPWDPEVLIPALILHDVDKPLLYARSETGCERTVVADEIPHGVLGGFLLKELGFDDRVTSIVTTHAANSPFHSELAEGWILHYADFFSADHALRLDAPDVLPFYQRHWVS